MRWPSSLSASATLAAERVEDAGDDRRADDARDVRTAFGRLGESAAVAESRSLAFLNSPLVRPASMALSPI